MTSSVADIKCSCIQSIGLLVRPTSGP